jgi:hypothetical protein
MMVRISTGQQPDRYRRCPAGRCRCTTRLHHRSATCATPPTASCAGRSPAPPPAWSATATPGGGDTADFTLDADNNVIERTIGLLGGVLLTKRGAGDTLELPQRPRRRYGHRRCHRREAGRHACPPTPTAKPRRPARQLGRQLRLRLAGAATSGASTTRPTSPPSRWGQAVRAGPGAVPRGRPPWRVDSDNDYDYVGAPDQQADVVGCSSCGTKAVGHGRRRVKVRDLPIAGRDVVVV